MEDSVRFFAWFITLSTMLFSTLFAASPYPQISDSEWSSFSKYLLSENHPAKGELDKIFNNHRDAVYSKQCLFELGFVTGGSGGHVWVMRHPKLEGYLVKFYRRHLPGYTPPGKDWQMWQKRIEGAQLIRDEIKKSRYSGCLKVPKKWIYPLEPQEDDDAINFLLVVEDMECLSRDENKELYKIKITKLHLKLIFYIVTKHGFCDGCSHNNLIWTKQGQLAFVDTESYHRWPVRYHPMLEYLSPDMRKWWRRYVKQMGEDPNH